MQWATGMHDGDQGGYDSNTWPRDKLPALFAAKHSVLPRKDVMVAADMVANC